VFTLNIRHRLVPVIPAARLKPTLQPDRAHLNVEREISFVRYRHLKMDVMLRCLPGVRRENSDRAPQDGIGERSFDWRERLRPKMAPPAAQQDQ
jgi:hypothetical protein